MFTLKFYRKNDTQGSVCRVIACPKYETSLRNGFVQVSIFRSIDDDDYADLVLLCSWDPSEPYPEAVHDILVGEQQGGRYVYRTLYVENSAGKTIDTIRA